MVTLNDLRTLTNNEGLTLKKGEAIHYKTGWQVATEGVECGTIQEAFKAIQTFNGNCGVWFANNIFYIDKSHRVKTKKEAMEIGRACSQISIYNWKTGGLAYC